MSESVKSIIGRSGSRSPLGEGAGGWGQSYTGSPRFLLLSLLPKDWPHAGVSRPTSNHRNASATSGTSAAPNSATTGHDAATP